ncbi:hypothetical protein [Ureibacillus sinduriensis]|uniref:Uncharacterized protein n=1 Tax=Ureibacillus sinduriensis BLB-1 = JCM 15800 TaxID=1384057 RepID=A0A0A3I2J2_9BACL|nr:hypothetical protein [Ureibacillus sinduriensis]KGR78929.1 hypothetical protein CD33_00825 [Ureibacillus sinduriensis BLB-1 = JCM 15800]
MPEIELINFGEIWTVTGPIIITAIILFFVGAISLVILSRMEKGFIKEIVRIGIIVGIAVVTLFSFQITSMVWGH